MQSKYEGLVILEAALDDKKKTDLIEKFSKMAGSDVKVDKWGVKKLAYPINYKNDGYYFLMTFEANGEVIEKISKLMNITNGVIRYMFTRIEEKKAVAKKSK